MLTHEGTLGISIWYWRLKLFHYITKTHKSKPICCKDGFCVDWKKGFMNGDGFERWDINTDEYESHNVFENIFIWKIPLMLDDVN